MVHRHQADEVVVLLKYQFLAIALEQLCAVSELCAVLSPQAWSKTPNNRLPVIVITGA